ncbi:Hansenula MRAKII killer toxin-resistant protein 1 [Actinoplanes sp. HUAS TT8]|uniref:Hansenula MRAKII killer toxin-resistant protein 1 n=1 Tax=Actinoplanes sp. HUAS TT8 TaxID=3447453 RepID=UPI003F523AB9
MAEKGWTSQAGAAAGIAAGAGAAQLGLGYGLGVIEWPAVATASDSTWLNSLGWATWITASATVLGAVIAGRMRAERAGPWRTLRRITLAGFAALGALVSVALVALPARSAVRPNGLFSHSPQLVAVGYALIGLVTGVVVAFWAISSAPVAANLLGTAAWLWALAVIGVAAELVTDRDLQTYLTSWQFAETKTPITYGGIYWPSAVLTLAAAFLIGLIMALPAARRGRLGLGTATSGAVGPLLVAVSFLSLAPLLTGPAGPLQSAYLIAPYAVLAGLAGSAITVSLAKGPRSRGGVEAVDSPLPLPAGQTAGDVDDASGPAPSSTSAPRATPVPAPRPAPGPAQAAAAAAVAPADPSDKPAVKSAKRSKFTSDQEPYAPDLSEEEEPGRRRWLFGRRRPAAEVTETKAEPTSSEPKGRGRKATKPVEAVATKPEPKPISAAKPEPKPVGAARPEPKPIADASKVDPKPVSTTARPEPKPVTPAAKPKPVDDGLADPEIAAAARPTKNAARRAAARKEATPRSTITPPPANPPIARINPKD